MVKLGVRTIHIEFQLCPSKRTLALLALAMSIAILAISPQPSYAQFVPCRIVTLNVVPPPLVQAGQPFQITTNLTISCDPSVLPVVRVDIVDEMTSATVSSNSVPYYPSLSSFTATVVNQATARQETGSWALEAQAYVISGVSGQVAASTSQLFQVNVQPYTPSTSETQTTAITTQVSSSSSAVTTQLLPAVTESQNTTETTTSSVLALNTQPTTSSTNQLLVPAAILLVGLVVFGLLVFAGNKRKQPPTPSKYCAQCGTQLSQNEKYCTKCGTKQTK